MVAFLVRDPHTLRGTHSQGLTQVSRSLRFNDRGKTAVVAARVTSPYSASKHPPWPSL